MSFFPAKSFSTFVYKFINTTLCLFLFSAFCFPIFFGNVKNTNSATKKSLTIYPLVQLTNFDYYNMSTDHSNLHLIEQFLVNTPNLTLLLDPTISLYENESFYNSLLSKRHIFTQKGNVDFVTNNYIKVPKKNNYKIQKNSIYIMPYNQLCDSTFSILKTNKVPFVMYPSNLDNIKVELDGILYQAFNLELNTIFNTKPAELIVKSYKNYQYNSDSSSIFLINNLFNNSKKLPYLSSLFQSKYFKTKVFNEKSDAVWDEVDITQTLNYSFTKQNLDELKVNEEKIKNYELAINEQQFDIDKLKYSFNSYDLNNHLHSITDRLKKITSEFTSSIKLELPQSLNLISQDVPLPISVKNGLGKKINVKIELIPEQNGILIRRSPKLEISKSSQQQVEIPITSLFSGQNNIIVKVYDETGRYLITSGKVSTNSIIEIGTFVFVAFISTIIILLLAGIFRTIKHNFGKDSRDHKYKEIINKD